MNNRTLDSKVFIDYMLIWDFYQL